MFVNVEFSLSHFNVCFAEVDKNHMPIEITHQNEIRLFNRSFLAISTLV